MTRSEGRRAIDGLLLVDKPAGMTSAAVVARVKRALRAAKVGHLGTLDPFATGLLPICLGEGTKLAPFISDATKRYVGEIVLGVETDTLDGTGTVTATNPVGAISTAALAVARDGLTGDIEQVPPMYSAVKRAGVPLYKIARRGGEVERAARPVRISRFDLARTAADRLAFAVTCSRGTYVRVLAQDLGRALGTGAHLATLRRTASGPFELGVALSLERVEGGTAETLPILTPSAALGDLRAAVIDELTIVAVRRGQQRALGVLGPPRSPREVIRLETATGELVAVAEAAADSSWRLARVLALPEV
jgi:tRNA pseudouridine55 synthase